MNDATRELGAALGVAVMGSIAVSGYARTVDSLTTGLPAESQDLARSSIAGAMQVAEQLPGAAGRALTEGAQAAFVDGIHLAVTVAAVVAWAAAVIVLKFLPRRLAHEGAMHGPVGSVEDVAELGLGGVPPVFDDERFPGPRVPSTIEP